MTPPESYISSFYTEGPHLDEKSLSHPGDTIFWRNRGAEFLADMGTCALVMWVSTEVCRWATGQHNDLLRKPLVNLVLSVCVSLFLLRRNNGKEDHRCDAVEATVRTVAVSFWGIVITMLLAFMHLGFQRLSLVVGFGLLVIALAIQRHLLRGVFTKRQSIKALQVGNAGTVESLSALEELVLLSTMATPHRYAAGKRIVDLSISSLLVVMLAPLFLLIAVLVRLTSDGSVFFAQERVGLGGRLFKIYKFRSMTYDSFPYDYSPMDARDPRITTVGRVLRKTGLDELPQLINVLLGEMSLVGPRPEMPFIVERYTGLQRQRLQVVPGITGLWQLSPERAFPIHENLHHDLFYIRQQRLSLDIAILVHTLMFAMSGGI